MHTYTSALSRCKHLHERTTTVDFDARLFFSFFIPLSFLPHPPPRQTRMHLSSPAWAQSSRLKSHLHLFFCARPTPSFPFPCLSVRPVRPVTPPPPPPSPPPSGLQLGPRGPQTPPLYNLPFLALTLLLHTPGPRSHLPPACRTQGGGPGTCSRRGGGGFHPSLTSPFRALSSPHPGTLSLRNGHRVQRARAHSGTQSRRCGDGCFKRSQRESAQVRGGF